MTTDPGLSDRIREAAQIIAAGPQGLDAVAAHRATLARRGYGKVVLARMSNILASARRQRAEAQAQPSPAAHPIDELKRAVAETPGRILRF